MSNWAFSHVTRHSIILVAAGLSFIAMGVSIRQYVPGGPRWESLLLARDVMSLNSWSIVFVVAGSLVTIFSHWPHIARTWGYTILTGMCGAWSAFYLVGASFVERPLLAGLSNGAVWALQGFIWWSISGLPDVAADIRLKMPTWRTTQ